MYLKDLRRLARQLADHSNGWTDECLILTERKWLNSASSSLTELLDERAKLISPLKYSRKMLEYYEPGGWSNSFNDFELSVEACSDIDTETP